MSVRKEKANGSAKYRRKLFQYYTTLELAAAEQKAPTAGFAINKLLDDCLDLPSPAREKAFVDGVLALSCRDELQWLSKAA